MLRNTISSRCLLTCYYWEYFWPPTMHEVTQVDKYNNVGFLRSVCLDLTEISLQIVQISQQRQYRFNANTGNRSDMRLGKLHTIPKSAYMFMWSHSFHSIHGNLIWLSWIDFTCWPQSRYPVANVISIMDSFFFSMSPFCSNRYLILWKWLNMDVVKYYWMFYTRSENYFIPLVYKRNDSWTP